MFHLEEQDEEPDLGTLIGPSTKLLRVSIITIIPEAPHAGPLFGVATRSGMISIGKSEFFDTYLRV